MNNEYIQNLRYKLQTRVRRLNSVHFNLYSSQLSQFWRFLHENSLVAGVIESLVARFPNINEAVQRILIQGEGQIFDNEKEHAAFSYRMLEACIKADADFPMKIMHHYHISPDGGQLQDYLKAFNEQFLEPFYDYIDEQLDDKGATLGLLRRYKHKAEWFCSKELFDLAESDTQQGEKQLAKHLYEYLHDQGIDFFIEPFSVSGKADLIGQQTGAEPLLADTKIFNPAKSKGTSYIAHGFNQVYIYTLNFNQPFGFLIIYNTSGDDLRFALADKSQSIPFLIHNNKTIFFMVIDIFPHEKPASKRGQLKTHEVTEELLVSVVSEEAKKAETESAPTEKKS